MKAAGAMGKFLHKQSSLEIAVAPSGREHGSFRPNDLNLKSFMGARGCPLSSCGRHDENASAPQSDGTKRACPRKLLKSRCLPFHSSPTKRPPGFEFAAAEARRQVSFS